jgi:uncharacterized coiled-coil protein SlyX
MSNLSNMMISGSYLGLINLEDSTQNLTSQSGYVELQDGMGENIGAAIDASSNNWRINKELSVSSSLDVTGSAFFRSDVDIAGDLDISGSFVHTGSIDVLGDVTIQGDVTANIGNFDTVNARLLNITEESASVIFSSGSNVLGDEESDTQTLIGQVIVSGTLGVEGNSAFTGSLTVSNEISSSTLNGIGNVTSYSASVDSRLDDLEFFSSSEYQTDSASFDNRINNLDNFTSSQLDINSGYNSYTSSTDDRLDNIEATTASLETNKLDVSVYNTDSASFDNRIDQLEADTGSQDNRLDSLEAFTGSQETINGFYNQHTESLNDFTSSQLNINSGYNTFTSSYYIDSASFDLRLDNQENFSSSLSIDFVSTPDFNSYTASIEVEQGAQDDRLTNIEKETGSIQDRLDDIELTTASLQVEVDTLSSFTGSYATTGSNTFDGDQVFSGSVQGIVNSLTITSNTASLDCSTGNFFTLSLPSGSSTNVEATNIVPGLTITLQIEQPLTGSSNLVFDTDDYSFPRLNQPSITPEAGAVDIATFVSFDTNKLKGVLTNDLI